MANMNFEFAIFNTWMDADLTLFSHPGSLVCLLVPSFHRFSEVLSPQHGGASIPNSYLLVSLCRSDGSQFVTVLLHVFFNRNPVSQHDCIKKAG